MHDFLVVEGIQIDGFQWYRQIIAYNEQVVVFLKTISRRIVRLTSKGLKETNFLSFLKQGYRLTQRLIAQPMYKPSSNARKRYKDLKIEDTR